MRKIWHTVTLICLLLLPFTLHAQLTPIQVTITAIPPYGPYLQDFIGSGSKVTATVRNLSQQSQQIKLYGSVTGDNGVMVRTGPGYQPPQPLNLAPMETRLLSSNDLNGLLDPSQVQVQGIDKSLLFTGKPLPEGDYQLCITAHDYTTSALLSPDAPFGCVNIPIRYIEPPQPISPLCDGPAPVTTPQGVIFTWAPPLGILPTQVQYTLRVVELPTPDIDPNVFIDAVVLPKSGQEVKNLVTNSYLYNPVAPGLIPGRRYAWRVQARDLSGKLAFLNEGKSPVCSFTYGEIPLLPGVLMRFARPGNCGDTISFGANNDLLITWRMGGELYQKLASVSPMPKVEMPAGDKYDPASVIAQAQANDTGKIISRIGGAYYQFSIQQQGYNFGGGGKKLGKGVAGTVVPASPPITVQTVYPYFADTSDTYEPVAGRTYTLRVELILPPQVRAQMGIGSQTIDATCSFKAIKRDRPGSANGLALKGKVFSIFKGQQARALPFGKVSALLVWPGMFMPIKLGETTASLYGNYNLNVADVLKAAGLAKLPEGARLRLRLYHPYCAVKEQDLDFGGSEIDAPNLIATAKAYDLTLTLRRAWPGWPGNKNEDLTGQLVVIYRRTDKQGYTHPDGEAMADKKLAELSDETPGSLVDLSERDAVGQMTLDPIQYHRAYVASGRVAKVGAEYQVVFKNMLFNVGPQEGYYVYAPNLGEDKAGAEYFNYTLAANTEPPASVVRFYTHTVTSAQLPMVGFSGQMNYQYADPASVGNVRPMPKGVRLKLRVFYVTDGAASGGIQKQGVRDVIDIHNANMGSPAYLQNGYKELADKDLASTTTTEGGGFNFPFVTLPKDLKLGKVGGPEGFGGGEFNYGYSGDAYRVLRVVVDDPYYSSPDKDYGVASAEQVVPGESVSLGTYLALVRSYAVKVKITAGGKDDAGQEVNKGQPIIGQPVVLCRYKRGQSGYLSYKTAPDDDGQGQHAFFKESDDVYAGFRWEIVSKGTTNSQGEAVFDRLILADSKQPNDVYQVATASDVLGETNFSSSFVGTEFSYTLDKSQLVKNNTSVSQAAQFASDYFYPTLSANRVLQPQNPRVRVRILDQNNNTEGVEGVTVRLQYNRPSVKSEGTDLQVVDLYAQTDEGGYAVFSDLAPGAKEKSGLPTISWQKEGWLGLSSMGQYNEVTYSPQAKPLKSGTNLSVTFYSIGNAIVKGQVRAEAAVGSQINPGIDAWVQVDGGKVYETQGFTSPQGAEHGRFEVYCSQTSADSLFIVPRDVTYFEVRKGLKGRFAKDPQNAKRFVANLGNITAPERRHRIYFQVKGRAGKGDTQPLPGALTKIQNQTFTAGTGGLTQVEVKNATQANLVLAVSKNGYVTKMVAVGKNDESVGFAPLPPVVLEKAAFIKGTAIRTYNKSNYACRAEVFVQAAGQTYACQADANGNFSLPIPEGLSGQVVVKGIYMRSQSDPFYAYYLGDIDTLTLPKDANKQIKLVFKQLTDHIPATVYGFKLSPTSIKTLGNGVWQVSGVVKLNDARMATGPFRFVDTTRKITVSNLNFIQDPSDAKLLRPQNPNVTLNIITADVGYTTAYSASMDMPVNSMPVYYNVKLKSGLKKNGHLVIEGAADGTGMIQTEAQIIDNSFKFPSTLLSYEAGQFYLFEPSASGVLTGTKPTIRAFRATPAPTPLDVLRKGFGLCKQDGGAIQMSLVTFAATSPPEGSRLDGESIVLAPTLTAPIQDVEPNTVQVTLPKVYIKNNTVDPQSGSEPIQIKLSSLWTIRIKNWSLDYQKGGIYSPCKGDDALVKTGKVDVALTSFTLRKAGMFIEAATIPYLSLAGVGRVVPTGKVFFGLDKVSGSDQSPHWALSVAPQVGMTSAGYLTDNEGSNIPGLNKPLNLAYISLLDNGQDVFGFGSISQSIPLYGVGTFQPATLVSGPDFFSIKGLFGPSIPRVQQLSAGLVYTAGPGGKPKLRLDFTDNIGFELPGYVQFKNTRANNIPEVWVQPNLLVMRGTAEEPGTFDKKNVLLVHKTGQDAFTRITHNRTIAVNQGVADVAFLANAANLNNRQYQQEKQVLLMEGGKQLKELAIDARVEGTDWGIVRFAGSTPDFTGMNMKAPDVPTALVNAGEQNRMVFEIHGEIKTGDDNKVGLTDIKMGPAKVSLVYEINPGQLVGTITLPKMDLDGGMSATGAGEMLFGKNGFYVALAAEVKNVPIIIPMTVKGGIMIAYYANRDFKRAEPIVFMYTHQKQFPCQFENEFKGFFFMGEVTPSALDDQSVSVNLGIAAAGVSVDGYVDGSFTAAYNGGKVLAVSRASVNAFATAYASAPLLSVSGKASVRGTVGSTLNGTNLHIQGQYGTGLTVSGCLDYLAGKVCSGDIDYNTCLRMGASYQIGTTNVDPNLSFKLSSCKATCE